MTTLLFKLMLLCIVATVVMTGSIDDSEIVENAALTGSSTDLQTSASSAKLLNLGGLFGNGGGNYPYRPGYYPSGSGNYPSSNYPSGGYPSSGYPSSGYPSSGYPSQGYNPSGGYYPNSGFYPSTNWNAGGGSYYPNSGGYYPNSGTNILGGGNGGYGGYGGNGGLRQYSGYWSPNYMGQRNLGYGYHSGSDRYGLPSNSINDRFGTRDRDRVAHSYRGYD